MEEFLQSGRILELSSFLWVKGACSVLGGDCKDCQIPMRAQLATDALEFALLGGNGPQQYLILLADYILDVLQGRLSRSGNRKDTARFVHAVCLRNFNAVAHW